MSRFAIDDHTVHVENDCLETVHNNVSGGVMYGFTSCVLILNAGSEVLILTNLTTSEKSSSVVVQLNEADSLRDL